MFKYHINVVFPAAVCSDCCTNPPKRKKITDAAPIADQHENDVPNHDTIDRPDITI